MSMYIIVCIVSVCVNVGKLAIGEFFMLYIKLYDGLPMNAQHFLLTGKLVLDLEY